MAEVLNPLFNWWGYVLLGLAAGALGGMLGVGGGALMVPALVILFSLGQKSAQGTALAAMIPMAFVAFLRYKLNPEIPIDGRMIGMLIAGGVVGAFIGAEIASKLPALVLRRIFAVFLVIVATKMFFVSAAGPSGRTATVPAEGIRDMERSDNR